MKVDVKGKQRLALLTGLAESAGFTLPPSELLRQLQEYDPASIDLMVQNMSWDRIGGGADNTEKERKNAVESSKRAWRSSPLHQWLIWTWTAWGLGEGVALDTKDTAAQATWDKFWVAPRNSSILGDHNLHEQSEDVLNEGNLFWAYYASPADGEVTIDPLDPDEITEIIYNPRNKREPWFYKREFVGDELRTVRPLYYPDWGIFFDEAKLERSWQILVELNKVQDDAIRADLVQRDENFGDAATTRVCVQHVSHNKKDRKSLWGWPISTVSNPYMKAHKSFVQARLAVAHAVSQYVRRSTVKGGSRAVNSVIDTVKSTLSQNSYIDNNPPPAPGSWHVQNQAMDTEELGMMTGAGNASVDNNMFAWIAGLGGGMFPTTLGLDVTRFATAFSQNKVQSYVFSRYQHFWSAQFRIMFRIVSGFAGHSMEAEVEVSIDAYGLADFPDMVPPTTAMMAAIEGSATIPPERKAEMQSALLRPAFQAIRARDVSDLMDFEAVQQQNEQVDRQQAAVVEVLRIASGNYERGEIDLDALLEVAVAAYAERGLEGD